MPSSGSPHGVTAANASVRSADPMLDSPSALEPRPVGGPGVRHGALVGLAHLGGVFGKKARLVAGRQRPPGSAAGGDFRGAEEQVHTPACCVDAHDVAVVHQRERASTAASGATWPTQMPRVAPENRPSVMSATASPICWP
jgi:hypothetical protein